MNGDANFEIEANPADSVENIPDYKGPEGRTLAAIYAKRYQERSDRLATFVNEEVENTGRPALGVNQRQKGIWVLQATNMPAILVETGFINNPEDERYINSEKGQQELAVAITKAVKRYKAQVESLNNAAPQPTAAVDKKNMDIAIPFYETRTIKEVKTINIKNKKITIDLYDDGDIDNDIVSVFFNKEMIVSKKALSTNPLSVTLNIEPDKSNDLILYAENLGNIPPNTALMIINDGSNRYEVRLTADLKNNASVKFELRINN
jgi:hypothetical protein